MSPHDPPPEPGSLKALAQIPPWELEGRAGKKKQADESAGREEREGAVELVAEWIACEEHFPHRLVQRGQWENFRFWSARAGGSAALLGTVLATGNLSLLGVVLATAPLLLAFSLGAHLDQLTGEASLRTSHQLARWGPATLELVPAYAVFLLLFGALLAVGSLGGNSAAPLILPLWAFLAFAWSCTLSEGVLMGHRGADAIFAGFGQALGAVMRWPLHTLRWATTLRWRARCDTGESHLLGTFFGSLVGLYVLFGLGFGLAVMLTFGSRMPLGPLSTAAGVWAMVATACLVLESSVGVWTHHYLAAKARVAHRDRLEATPHQSA